MFHACCRFCRSTTQEDTWERTEMAIQCGMKASTMISEVHALLLETFYAFLWILILKSLEPIVNGNTSSIVACPNIPVI